MQYYSSQDESYRKFAENYLVECDEMSGATLFRCYHQRDKNETKDRQKNNNFKNTQFHSYLPRPLTLNMF